MAFFRHGGLLSNHYATHTLPIQFSNGKIWEAICYTTIAMRSSSSSTAQSINENHMSRNLEKDQERKVRNVAEEHHKQCNLGRKQDFRKPSYCWIANSSSCNGFLQLVTMSVKHRSLSSSNTRTERGRRKRHLLNTSGTSWQPISQSYGQLSMNGLIVRTFDIFRETLRSSLSTGASGGLSDYSYFQTRNIHKLVSSNWQPCSSDPLLRAVHPYTAACISHVFPSQGMSNDPAVIRCASTTTTRDKLRAKIRSNLPALKEEELEEQFVRGSGPGGQATNKTSNCVVLRHIPTGIVIKCHQTRSVTENQKIARLLMKEKLDQHLHGDKSAIAQHQQAMHKKREEKKRKTRLKLEKLKALRLSDDGQEEESSDGDQDTKDKDS